MAGGKSVYVLVSAEGVHGVYSTETAANAVMETMEGTVVESHDLKTTGRKSTAKRSSSEDADGAPVTKKSKKADAKPLIGIPDVFMGKNVCFLGTMSLKRDLLELTASNHGGNVTKKTEDADVIVLGAHISEKQSKDLNNNQRETITEEQFRDWLTTGVPQ